MLDELLVQTLIKIITNRLIDVRINFEVHF